MSSDKLFEMSGMWIGRVAGSRLPYRVWYDRGHGETRRRSLETTDLEEAKRLMAELAAEDHPIHAAAFHGDAYSQPR